MTIRSVTESDIPALARAYIEAFKEVDPSEVWTDEKAIELIRFFYSRQPDMSFLIEENGQIGGGVLGMIKPWWDGNHVVETELFLTPSFQNRGLGAEIFKYYLEYAKKQYQAAYMESLTFKDLDFPLSWYIKLGFEAKSDWQVMFGNVDTVISGLNK